MEQLPDHAVLRMLQFLDVTSLLTCRLVCRRLGDLVLNADAWRHRTVCVTTCACPELRLAPCLQLLDIKSDKLSESSCLPAALVWTRCAVAKLHLRVAPAGDLMAGVATAAILRQAGLGRLRSLVVHVRAGLSDSVHAMLLAAVASARGLEEVEVDVTDVVPGLMAISLGSTAVTPSLKRFECVLAEGTEPFVNFILAGHADTLETVRLYGAPFSAVATSTAPILARMAQLRQLTCYVTMLGLEAVAACKALRVLKLCLSSCTREDRAACAGAVEVLRRAENLRELNLSGNAATARVFVELFQALALNTRSRLESLKIRLPYRHNRNGPSLRALISALPSLAALQHLHLRYVTDTCAKQVVDDLMLAITPTTAPALRRVQLEPPALCVHGWLHGDAFQTAMARNPLLHFTLDCFIAYCRDTACKACTQGCHAVLLGMEEESDDSDCMEESYTGNASV
ncbi:uncharacterized protein LOC127749281 [Frankliniella occidentalis]|uniref:Uncharacterized protein LOC127749281 n=1 Tax=Frankliniella occidentalis TaxID=133901 RepID=A0A9C6U460_FRAOC|nr:uncharacterized protein LOC127749281 [Frankliniella occidentalis]XP_052122740.1 uncharacterized protein LOC127749281 [Frankliniella occidentalis]